MDLEKKTYEEDKNNTVADSNGEGSRTIETLLKWFKIVVVVLCVAIAIIILCLIALCVVVAALVMQAQRSNQLEQKIEYLQNNSNCTCAILGIDSHKSWGL